MRFSYFLAILFAMILFGCSGGSNDITNTNGNNPPPPIVSPSMPAVDKTFGTLRLIAPAYTLPANSNISVSQTTPTTLPPNQNFLTVNNQAAINIDLGSTPQNPVTISFQDTRKRSGRYTYLLVAQINGVTRIINSVQHTVNEELKFVIAPSWFVGGKILAVMGKNLITTPSTYTGRVLLATDSNPSANRAILLTHGWNATVDGMRPLAAKIIQYQNQNNNHRYGKIYGFEYDYTQSGSVVSAGLDVGLDTFKNEGVNIDMVNHSWGAPVGRNSLEVDGKTEAVHSFFSVCGANLGSTWASADDILRGLQEDYLNATGTNLPAGILSFDSPVMQDLVPNSPFLISINRGVVFHRGIVRYHEISTGDDKVVGSASGAASGINLFERTAGFVDYKPVSASLGYGHSGLLQKDDGLNLLVSEIFREDAASPIAAGFSPTPCQMGDYGGSTYLYIQNNSGSVISLRDLSFQGYDADGDIFTAAWYDPALNGTTTIFDDKYVGWNRWLNAGETVTIPLYLRYDGNNDPVWNAPSYRKAQTLLALIRGTDGAGRPFLSTSQVILYSSGYWPSSPDIRSARTRSCDRIISLKK